jgi:hypothetical protein
LMTEPNFPPRGDTEQIARLCTRHVRGEFGPAESTCGKPATHHVFWDYEPGDNAYACKEHVEEIKRRWTYFQIHPLADCGMPGALWFPEERTCRYDEEGLPVAERHEALVPAGGRA